MPLEEKTSLTSTCSYCGVGCGILINKDRKGNLTVEGDPNHPVNRGMLCSKGMNLHYVVEDKTDRMLHPQMRWNKNYPMQRVNWDTALNRAAAVFSSLIEQYGPDSVGFYVSGQCLTEEYYLVNKLTKGFLGTNNIDTNSRLCMSSAVAAYAKTLGEDAVPVSYDDIELADCFFIAGSNPAWCHPILFRRIELHKENNPDVKIIVVDPRKTQTCALADLHLQIKPGTDTVLYHAIGRCLIESGDIDINFIRNHTDGFEPYQDEVMQITLEEAATICEVPLADIRYAARLISESKGFLTLWAMGLNQSAAGVNKNLALINLNLITGHIGKPGSGPFSLTGQPNAMGGREVGGMASLLAAHRNLLNPAHRQEVANFWGVKKIAEKPGFTATQMFDALESGEMKAIWIVCTNPMVSLPDARRAEEALKKAKFVVVQDISVNSDTAQYADLLLPAAGWLEKEGTMTNSERRISYLPKVVDAPGEAMPDGEILWRFAQKMGFAGFDYQDMSEVYAEHCALTQGTHIDISGLSYHKLKQAGSVQWPVPSKDHTGTPRLFTDKKFYTPNQRAQICTSGAANLSEPVTPDFPLILTTGRIRDQWHTMTRTGKVNKLTTHINKPFLEIHPEDARERKIKAGDTVVVNNGRGEVRVHAKVTDTIKKGVVFLPMHWGKILKKDFSRANNLTQNVYDPVSKEPDFKFSAVQVSLFQKPKQRIVVIGAGAAAYRFINTYRELNQEDEIRVFSKEKYPFYNRVLLPEYVNDKLVWEKLLKFKEGELESLNVKLHIGKGIVEIDKLQKTVIDSQGQIFDYDILVMATGSRAFIPSDAPVHLPGIFTMRNRENAEDLKKYLNYQGKVLIVGGGLLGLELAASLRELKIEVIVVQLASRLMQRQLDELASTLLREKVEEMGIQVLMNDQVQTVENDQNAAYPLYARLKSGKSISCNAIVYAVGTRPNIALAQEAELECGKGVKVNQYLQTSNPSIFAIGEIAEYNQQLYGFTSAAEQQADILANFINGDLLSFYSGSVLMNILKFSNLDLCSVGITEIPHHAKEYEEILFIDKSKTFYKKCIIHKDKLVGAILMGDKLEFAEFKSLIENKTELSEKRMRLLRSGEAVKPVAGPLVCSCGNVGKGNIEQAIEGGCCSFNEICKITGAGLGCGSCKPEVKSILDSKLLVVK